MLDPIDHVVQRFPVSFFKNLQEQSDTAFSEAYRLTELHIEEPEKQNAIGQLRHARCEAAFRNAANDSGLNAFAKPTNPPGSRYSLIEKEGFYLIRGNVQYHCGTPRATRFRKEFSLLNQWLEPLQDDLFQETSSPPSDKLCGIVIATAYKNYHDQTVPAFLGLGIPHSDLSDWMILEPIEKIIARYHDIETAQHTQKEAAIEIKDIAIPKLKSK